MIERAVRLLEKAYYRTDIREGIANLTGVTVEEVDRAEYPQQITIPEFVHSTSLEALNLTLANHREYRINFDYQKNSWTHRKLIVGTVHKIKSRGEDVQISASTGLMLDTLFTKAPTLFLHTHPPVPDHLLDQFANGSKWLKSEFEKVETSEIYLEWAKKFINVNLSLFSPSDLVAFLFRRWEFSSFMLYTPSSALILVRNKFGLYIPQPSIGILEKRLNEYNRLLHDTNGLNLEEYKLRMVRKKAGILQQLATCYYSDNPYSPIMERVVS